MDRLFFQVVTFNFGYLSSNFPGAGIGSHILRITNSIDHIDEILFVAGFMGWCSWAVLRRQGSDRSPVHLGAILIAAAFAGLSAVNHQGPADLVPLQVMSILGFPAALALVGRRFTPGTRKAVIVLMLLASVFRAVTMQAWERPPRLDDQRSVLAPIVKDLSVSGRGVWCAGAPELLVLFDLPNATPYTYLHSNVYQVLEETEAMPLWRFVLERVSIHGDLVVIDRIPAHLDQQFCTELKRAAPEVVIRRGAEIGMKWRPKALLIFQPIPSSAETKEFPDTFLAMISAPTTLNRLLQGRYRHSDVDALESPLLFSDGFETGKTMMWSASLP